MFGRGHFIARGQRRRITIIYCPLARTSHSSDHSNPTTTACSFRSPRDVTRYGRQWSLSQLIRFDWQCRVSVAEWRLAASIRHSRRHFVASDKCLLLFVTKNQFPLRLLLRWRCVRVTSRVRHVLEVECAGSTNALREVRECSCVDRSHCACLRS